MSVSSLEIGGSIGSLRGKFYEFYLIRLLNQNAYHARKRIGPNNPTAYYLRYRFPPDEITEIDLYFPNQRVGFWLTCLGKIKKIRCIECSSKKFNEFKKISGFCPHCNEGKLPTTTGGFSGWICPKCGRIADPLELRNKTCVCGSKNFEEYEDRSASTQAHKQTYYRLAEYLEVKTADFNSVGTSANLDVLCSEIIFNEKSEWRIWWKVLESFFDTTLFVFENNPELFGSDFFNNKVWEFIDNNLNRKYHTNKFSTKIVQYLLHERSRKNGTYSNWYSHMAVQRKKYWGEEYPAAYPVRYSIFTVLKALGKRSYVDPYEIGVIWSYLKKKSSSSKPLGEARKRCIKKGYIKNNKVTKKGIDQIELAVKKYQELFKTILDYQGPIHKYDLWLRERRELVVSVLSKLLELSKREGWYKFSMIANRDIDQISATPYISAQFEPLEILVLLFLEDFEKQGIISGFEGLQGSDVYEPTFLRKALKVDRSSSAFKLGEDAKIELPNGKVLYLQCKSNTSFKKWNKTGQISSSGISYKDAKRMVAHNLISSFKYENNELVHDDNRYYVAVIDGDWASGKNDLFRLIRAMYTLGVDEIFFADEISTRLKDFLAILGKTS